MKISEMTIEQLLKKRDYHKDLIQLHSLPQGLRTYREYHEQMVEGVDKEIKRRTEANEKIESK
jgi:hypothetical protein